MNYKSKFSIVNGLMLLATFFVLAGAQSAFAFGCRLYVCYAGNRPYCCPDPDGNNSAFSAPVSQGAYSYEEQVACPPENATNIAYGPELRSGRLVHFDGGSCFQYEVSDDLRADANFTENALFNGKDQLGIATEPVTCPPGKYKVPGGCGTLKNQPQ
jgi:hypothetical protein